MKSIFKELSWSKKYEYMTEEIALVFQLLHRTHLTGKTD